jgi:hypothetical protein
MRFALLPALLLAACLNEPPPVAPFCDPAPADAGGIDAVAIWAPSVEVKVPARSPCAGPAERFDVELFDPDNHPLPASARADADPHYARIAFSPRAVGWYHAQLVVELETVLQLDIYVAREGGAVGPPLPCGLPVVRTSSGAIACRGDAGFALVRGGTKEPVSGFSPEPSDIAGTGAVIWQWGDGGARRLLDTGAGPLLDGGSVALIRPVGFTALPGADDLVFYGAGSVPWGAADKGSRLLPMLCITCGPVAFREDQRIFAQDLANDRSVEQPRICPFRLPPAIDAGPVLTEGCTSFPFASTLELRAGARFIQTRASLRRMVIDGGSLALVDAVRLPLSIGTFADSRQWQVPELGAFLVPGQTDAGLQLQAWRLPSNYRVVSFGPGMIVFAAGQNDVRIVERP